MDAKSGGRGCGRPVGGPRGSLHAEVPVVEAARVDRADIALYRQPYETLGPYSRRSSFAQHITAADGAIALHILGVCEN